MPDLHQQKVNGGQISPAFLVNGAQGVNRPLFGSETTVACGTAATSGDNELIPAPGAGNRIVVWSFIVQNESSTDTTAILKDYVPRWRRLLSQGDAMTMLFDLALPWMLNANSALTLNLSGANSHGYSIHYSIEPVQ